jgi:hypothetical protein
MLTAGLEINLALFRWAQGWSIIFGNSKHVGRDGFIKLKSNLDPRTDERLTSRTINK